MLAPEPEAVDIDGDGVLDLLVNAARYTHLDVPGRVFFFAGPFDDDRDAADADLMIDGARPGDDFGQRAVAIANPVGGDGRTVVFVTDFDDPDQRAHFVFRIGDLDVVTLLTEHDADAAFVEGDDGVLDISTGLDGPTSVGDIDADGREEVAIQGYASSTALDISGERLYIMEIPTAGTHTLHDPEFEVRPEESVDGYTGMGSYVEARFDLDGDGWRDLLVGEFYWDDDPTIYHHPNGRFHVFRGPVGE